MRPAVIAWTALSWPARRAGTGAAIPARRSASDEANRSQSLSVITAIHGPPWSAQRRVPLQKSLQAL